MSCLAAAGASHLPIPLSRDEQTELLMVQGHLPPPPSSMVFVVIARVHVNFWGWTWVSKERSEMKVIEIRRGRKHKILLPYFHI